jgi:dTDP-4-dehydrorhamnose reductase
VTVGIDALVDRVRPAVIVNCTGALKPVDGTLDPAEANSVNALAPHQMAAAARARGMRLIHVSTDCVFDGKRGNYAEGDAPDAADLYGRSKALGEVDDGVSLTIRTSMVGRQLRGSRGLLEWLLSHRGGTVQGYRAMRFSGLSTLALARTIVNVITNHPALSGRIHVGGDAISKYDLLHIMNDTFKAGVTIVPVEGPPIDRSLDSRRFAALAGTAPSWHHMLDEAAGDPTPYDQWRQRVS